MKNNRLIIKFLAVFILLMSGIDICIAQCTGTVSVEYEIENGEAPALIPGGPHDYSLGSGSTCVFRFDGVNWATWDISGLGISCGDIGGCQATREFITPIADASFLLVFLLGVYGVYLYRRRRVA